MGSQLHRSILLDEVPFGQSCIAIAGSSTFLCWYRVIQLSTKRTSLVKLYTWVHSSENAMLVLCVCCWMTVSHLPYFLFVSCVRHIAFILTRHVIRFHAMHKLQHKVTLIAVIGKTIRICKPHSLLRTSECHKPISEREYFTILNFIKISADVYCWSLSIEHASMHANAMAFGAKLLYRIYFIAVWNKKKAQFTMEPARGRNTGYKNSYFVAACYSPVSLSIGLLNVDLIKGMLPAGRH